MAISDAQLADLSSNPKEAFIQFERLARQEMENTRHENNWDAEIEYVTAVSGFCDIYSIEGIDTIDYIPNDQQEFGAYFSRFFPQVKTVIWRFRIENAKLAGERRLPTLTLGPETRRTLRFHLDQMRDLVAELDLADKKRESITTCINALQREIETNRTKREALLGLAIEIADTVNEVDQRTIKLRQIMDAILKRIGKEIGQLRQLPAPEEQRQLPAPEASPGAEDLAQETEEDAPF